MGSPRICLSVLKGSDDDGCVSANYSHKVRIAADPRSSGTESETVVARAYIKKVAMESPGGGACANATEISQVMTIEDRKRTLDYSEGFALKNRMQHVPHLSAQLVLASARLRGYSIEPRYQKRGRRKPNFQLWQGEKGKFVGAQSPSRSTAMIQDDSDGAEAISARTCFLPRSIATLLEPAIEQCTKTSSMTRCHWRKAQGSTCLTSLDFSSIPIENPPLPRLSSKPSRLGLSHFRWPYLSFSVSTTNRTCLPRFSNRKGKETSEPRGGERGWTPNMDVPLSGSGTARVRPSHSNTIRTVATNQACLPSTLTGGDVDGSTDSSDHSEYRDKSVEEVSEEDVVSAEDDEGNILERVAAADEAVCSDDDNYANPVGTASEDEEENEMDVDNGAEELRTPIPRQRRNPARTFSQYLLTHIEDEELEDEDVDAEQEGSLKRNPSADYYDRNDANQDLAPASATQANGPATAHDQGDVLGRIALSISHKFRATCDVHDRSRRKLADTIWERRNQEKETDYPMTDCYQAASNLTSDLVVHKLRPIIASIYDLVRDLNRNDHQTIGPNDACVQWLLADGRYHCKGVNQAGQGPKPYKHLEGHTNLKFKI
ncbi:hypothetical protein SISSUDRAFT_1038460 [Sistotremastrum suecicum HHB10207 ss-3]|uniref:DUF6532 domain-containing protein n=1 Tax=Sistotremastrum suecicum HHB10207 ss-3 TaxID=1314776 RepID=A0A165WPZ8_9AGAM|nr:hypothetical protein SISSUDRAFT_1038460 [Sistotremastrum suecicum HHB10207 ss-3]